MGLDIRVPIGMMFLVFGAILTIYGVVSDSAVYAKSLGININLSWGVVLLVFGAVMLFLGMRGNRTSKELASAAPSQRRAGH
jgi:hypothetical protein